MSTRPPRLTGLSRNTRRLGAGYLPPNRRYYPARRQNRPAGCRSANSRAGLPAPAPGDRRRSARLAPWDRDRPGVGMAVVASAVGGCSRGSTLTESAAGAEFPFRPAVGRLPQSRAAVPEKPSRPSSATPVTWPPRLDYARAKSWGGGLPAQGFVQRRSLLVPACAPCALSRIWQVSGHGQTPTILISFPSGSCINVLGTRLAGPGNVSTWGNSVDGASMNVLDNRRD